MSSPRSRRRAFSSVPSVSQTALASPFFVASRYVRIVGASGGSVTVAAPLGAFGVRLGATGASHRSKASQAVKPSSARKATTSSGRTPKIAWKAALTPITVRRSRRRPTLAGGALRVARGT